MLVKTRGRLANTFGLLGLGLVVLSGAGLMMSGPTGDHDYLLTIQGSGTPEEPFVVVKPGALSKFEVDYPYLTTWQFTNAATVPVDIQIDEFGQAGTCHIIFTSQDVHECRSAVLSLAAAGASGSSGLMQATARPWGALYYTGPSDLLVGPHDGTLISVDPDLEVERDIFMIALTSVVAGAVFLSLWWFFRRRVDQP